MKILAFFNHKGGVAKTTNCFHVAWKLAEEGKRVILVDADSQCNLTGLVMGLNPIDVPAEVDEQQGDIEDQNSSTDKLVEKFSDKANAQQEAAKQFWNSIEDNNIHSALSPAFNSEPKPLEPVEVIPVEGNKNLMLLPGSIDLAEYESDLALAQSLQGALGSQKNIPGAIHHLLKITGEKYNADYILVDLSPSLGAINQNVVCISDGIIIPCAPDYFSVMALRSLSAVLPRWREWAQSMADSKGMKTATYEFPAPKFKLIGIAISRFVLYKRKPASAFATWIKNVVDTCNTEFVPALEDAGIKTAFSGEQSENRHLLAQIREFNSLRPRSQDLKKPVFALTDVELGVAGQALDNMKSQRADADTAFQNFASKLLQA